jgi:molybdate transport system ATP-binding protein
MLRINIKKKLTTAEGPLDLAVDLQVEKGEFVTIYGPSGAGKTTILRMIAGLVKPDEGMIEVAGEVWFDSAKGIDLPVRKRRTGFVFQEYSLFPNMTVRGNLEYALENKNKIGLIDEFLETVSLTGLQDRKPDHLSGGQKQRVALIRALLREPQVYLLDEPLAALDIEMRGRLQDEIIRLYRKAAVTTIFVSHDIPEVFKLASKVFVLNEGKIIKSGSAKEIFSGNQISGKFKFPGEIIEIRKDEGVNILTILVGNNSVKVVATDEEIQGLSVGSKIIVASKAFNPIIIRNASFAH